MDFEQDERERGLAREFGESVIAGSLIARDQAATWDGALIRALAVAGSVAADPSALVLSQRLIGFAEGSGDAGLALAWASHTIGCTIAIDRAATPEQRARYLPMLTRGECLGGLAHAEPERVRARPSGPKGEGWRLEGTKTRVVNAPVADLFVVSACCDPQGDIAIFLVDRGSPGLHVGARIETPGLRTATIGALTFEGCELPAASRLGDGHTFALIRRWQRACLLAPAVGLLGVLVDACFAAGRRRASQPERALLADLRIRIALCRHVQSRAAWRLDHGGDELERELAIASAMLGESLASMAHAAHVFAEPLGSPGPIERLARDASTLTRLFDDAEPARAVVAASLLGSIDDGGPRDEL
jgi:alkylation response protein AidB-like acyl-CoA dehydrogenase